MSSRTLHVSVPHRLTQDEVKGKIQQAVGQMRQGFAGHAPQVEENWQGNQLSFKVAVMGQSVTGRVDVLPEKVDVAVDLPWMLAMLGDKIKRGIETEGQKLLGPPRPTK